MSREEAIEMLSDMRAEYNLFGDEKEATRYHVLSWAIQEMQAAQQWIPCKERLPKPNETKELVRKYYLTQNEWGDMMVACYEGDATKNWWEQMYQYKETEDKIVAWMPLPEPWRGEEDE